MMDNDYWKEKYADVHIRLTNRIAELEKENEELKKTLLEISEKINESISSL